MDLGAFFSLISTATLVAGLLFAVMQIQYFRARRRRDAALALVQSYQSPEFARAIFESLEVPDGLTWTDFVALPSHRQHSAYLLMTTWESLGILVFRGEVDIALVEDFFSGPIVKTWSKYRIMIGQKRELLARETYFEWFQWLAERVMERETARAPVPAHIEHRNWKA